MTIPCTTCEGTGLVVRVIETGLLKPWFRNNERTVIGIGDDPPQRCRKCGGDGRIDKEPKAGDLRVWAIRNPPGAPTLVDVMSIQEATAVIGALSQSDRGMPWVAANVFGLEVFEDGEWSEWENPNGQTIEDVLDET